MLTIHTSINQDLASRLRHHVLDVLHDVLVLELEKLNLIILLQLNLCLLHHRQINIQLKKLLLATMLLLKLVKF